MALYLIGDVQGFALASVQILDKIPLSPSRETP